MPYLWYRSDCPPVLDAWPECEWRTGRWRGGSKRPPPADWISGRRAWADRACWRSQSQRPGRRWRQWGSSCRPSRTPKGSLFSVNPTRDCTIKRWSVPVSNVRIRNFGKTINGEREGRRVTGNDIGRVRYRFSEDRESRFTDLLLNVVPHPGIHIRVYLQIKKTFSCKLRLKPGFLVLRKLYQGFQNFSICTA